MMPLRPILLAIAAMVSSGAASAQETVPAPADSLTMERTPCFGTCPAYRLTLTVDGRVTFVTTHPSGSPAIRDTVPAGTLDALLRRAEMIGFFTLPEDLIATPSVCGSAWTDHPTVILRFYFPTETTVVKDYHGCPGPADGSARELLVALRALENAVDAVTGADRWITPARWR
jgi:hypothetical protein